MNFDYHALVWSLCLVLLGANVIAWYLTHDVWYALPWAAAAVGVGIYGPRRFGT